MKALVGAFNQEKALVGAFSVIVQPVVEPMDRFAALLTTHPSPLATTEHLRCTGPGLLLLLSLLTPCQLRLLQTPSVSTSKSPPSSLLRVSRSQEPVTRILRVRLHQIIMTGTSFIVHPRTGCSTAALQRH